MDVPTLDDVSPDVTDLLRRLDIRLRRLISLAQLLADVDLEDTPDKAGQVPIDAADTRDAFAVLAEAAAVAQAALDELDLALAEIRTGEQASPDAPGATSDDPAS
jgi:hypothetical protein